MWPVTLLIMVMGLEQLTKSSDQSVTPETSTGMHSCGQGSLNVEIHDDIDALKHVYLHGGVNAVFVESNR